MDETLTKPIFVEVVLDPTLIKGIYDACDQWCMYCEQKRRCLAYRCSPELESGKTNVYRSLSDRMSAGMIFLKRLSDAEGRPTPEIDVILSNDPAKQQHVFDIDDPLERMGRRYMKLAQAYLISRPDYPFDMKWRASGPTPFEVFAWFHALVPAKIYRALVSARQAARGVPDRQDDARRSAKVALIGIDRSVDALTTLMTEDEDPRLELLRAQLRRLRREVDGRFPDAKSIVRIGLDCPAPEVPEPPQAPSPP
jgi:hypothetical protein